MPFYTFLIFSASFLLKNYTKDCFSVGIMHNLVVWLSFAWLFGIFLFGHFWRFCSLVSFKKLKRILLFEVVSVTNQLNAHCIGDIKGVR